MKKLIAQTGDFHKMSSQSFRKKTRVVLTNMDLKLFQYYNNTHGHNSNKYLNSSDCCIVCGGGCSFDIQEKMIEPLVGHHVKYFPPIIAFVHYSCHKKIHDMDNPMSVFIQYEKGDSKKYYDSMKKNIESNKSKLKNLEEISGKNIIRRLYN